MGGTLGHTDYVKALYPRRRGRGRHDRRIKMTGMPRVGSSSSRARVGVPRES